MTRLVEKHPALAARALPRIVVAALGAGTLLLVATAADAAFTTGACLAEKRAAWVNLRKCQGTEQVKRLKGKLANFPKCRTKFDEKRAKIATKAAKATIACRYGANSAEGTVTDYDTGLEWEAKDGEVGGVCFLFVDRVNHCVNATYTWAEAQSFASGVSTDGTTVSSFFPGSADWRLPTIVELRTIVDMTAPGCNSGSPCIDPIFGPTVDRNYWSATTDLPDYAWFVSFDDGSVDWKNKGFTFSVRAVRTAL